MNESTFTRSIEADDEWLGDSALEEIVATLKRDAPEGCLICKLDDVDDE